MRKLTLALLLLLFSNFYSVYGQPIAYNTIPASCATCCDGTFTMTVLNSTSFAFLSTPTLAVTSWSINVLVFNNVCSGAYTINIITIDISNNVTDYFSMPFSTGLTSMSESNREISFYPNPTSKMISTNYLPKKRFNISDETGRIVIEETTDTNEISIEPLERGFYWVTLFTEDNQLIGRTKILKD